MNSFMLKFWKVLTFEEEEPRLHAEKLEISSTLYIKYSAITTWKDAKSM